MTENIKIAIQASLEAGQAIMEVYNSPIEVEYKEDNSPLTVADSKSNDVINKYLLETGIPIISEENKQIDYEVRKQWHQCWIVDPLDGTKEFIKRNGEFTVNIALVENSKPQEGVIYVPVSKELYFGDVKKGEAFKATISGDETVEEIIGKAEKIQPHGVENKIRVVGSRSHMNEETTNYVKSLDATKEVEIVSKGSSLKFCLVAEGNADIYPRFAPTMEWDTAAGQAICNAAGLKVIANNTQESLDYNKENLLNPWFLVTMV